MVSFKCKNRGGILDVIISFFRDVLSGPLYIIVVVISVIGIFSCIGYLAERIMNEKETVKKQKEMYAEVHLLPTTDAQSASEIASNVSTTISSAQVNQVGTITATNLAQSDVVSVSTPPVSNAIAAKDGEDTLINPTTVSTVTGAATTSVSSDQEKIQ